MERKIKASFVATAEDARETTINVWATYRREHDMRSGHYTVENALKDLITDDGRQVNPVEGERGKFYVMDDPDVILISDDPIAIELSSAQKQRARRN